MQVLMSSIICLIFVQPVPGGTRPLSWSMWRQAGPTRAGVFHSAHKLVVSNSHGQSGLVNQTTILLESKNNIVK